MPLNPLTGGFQVVFWQSFPAFFVLSFLLPYLKAIAVSWCEKRICSKCTGDSTGGRLKYMDVIYKTFNFDTNSSLI